MNNYEKFPSHEWMEAIKVKLNTDEHYSQVAKNWEGDLRFILEVDNSLPQEMWLYFDLWHGKCRETCIEDQSSNRIPAFVLRAPYGNFVKVLSREVGPMQALLTRMLNVQGSMAYMMRNVPTILDFVRCCQEVTHSWI